MPKLRKQKEVKLRELKELIRKGIKEKYNMNVMEFIKSDRAKQLGINKSLSSYLAPAGSSSYITFGKLVKDLGIGKLKKEIKVQRVVQYFI